MPQPLTHICLSSILALLLLAGCGGGNEAAPIPPTQTPAVTLTAPPPTSTPTTAPSATPLPPGRTATTLLDATATPAADSPDSTVANDTPMLILRTIPTSDGFVAVRQEPTTASSEITRLRPYSEVTCTGFVAGEALLFGSIYSDQWAECPGAGGYIFAMLLEAADAPVAAPDAPELPGVPPAGPDGNAEAIIAAVRAHVGELTFTYGVEDICVDGNLATATVVPAAGAADPVQAILEHIDGSWTVIHFQPGMPILGASYRAQLGIPVDFACLGEPVAP